VTYVDVVSGWDPIAMMLRISDGVNAGIEAPTLIFKNQKWIVSHSRVADNLPGIVYRAEPQGWMDKRLFCDWLLEPHVHGRLVQGKQRVLNVDNCS